MSFVFIKQCHLFINSTSTPTIAHSGLKCFDDLGCFPKLFGCVIPQVTDPLPPEDLGVSFHIYSGDLKDKIAYPFKDDQIEMLNFNSLLPTKVIIHGFKNGFIDDDTENWMVVREKCNAII